MRCPSLPCPRLGGALRRACLIALAAAMLPQHAQAQYPERPVRVVVAVAAGASTDNLARVLAQGLSQRLGKSFIVDNKPGAATRIGMETVARAAPDGYTIGIANAIVTTFPLMFSDFKFEPGVDFAPVAMLGRVPSLLAVRSSLPVRNGAEFAAYARAHANKLTFGHAGIGSNTQIAALLLAKSLGADAIGAAYKGNAPVAVALAGGEIDFAFLDYLTVRPLVERGNVRLIAVSEPRRMALLPNLPTAREAGLTSAIEGITPWFMLVAPAGTPPAVVARLSREAGEILSQPDVQQRLQAVGIEAETAGPAASLAFFRSEADRMQRSTRELGISLKN